MDHRKQDALARQAVRVAESGGNFGQKGDRRTRVLTYGPRGLALVDDAVDMHDDLVKRILGHADWSERFSEKYIEKTLRKLLVEVSAEESAAERGDEAARAMTALVERLEAYAEEHVCYVPLAGLRSSEGDVSLGRVLLKELSEDDVDRLADQVRSTVLSSKMSEEEKGSMADMQTQVLRGLQGTVCAEFRVVAEPIKAQERAEEETRRVLDLLRSARAPRAPTTATLRCTPSSWSFWRPRCCKRRKYSEVRAAPNRAAFSLPSEHGEK